MILGTAACGENLWELKKLLFTTTHKKNWKENKYLEIGFQSIKT